MPTPNEEQMREAEKVNNAVLCSLSPVEGAPEYWEDAPGGRGCSVSKVTLPSAGESVKDHCRSYRCTRFESALHRYQTCLAEIERCMQKEQKSQQ